ncbi:immune inhibitor A domain-containing protein [Nocardioides coralli]|uniref:immune inhibitor A domain-containing protein n=1 Tax=Nocardioides coralli TaxID=2872154 RepID=UPI001CA4522B|nr:immune inhibitor A domain-containing protein [Nocardioides coralli]QZY29948.1 immune inhibitor A [Nocardioides coralli]
MQRKKIAALGTAILTSAALMQPFTAGSVNAAAPAPSDVQAPQQAAPDRVGGDQHGHDLSMPWQRKYEGLRDSAVQKRLRTGSKATVQRVAEGQYARSAVTGKDRIFAVIVEYGNTRHSAFCDDTDSSGCKYPSDGTPQKYDGPMHNEIPKPNRKLDNSTNWQPDYDRAHYQDMYFNRMRKFYENQSLGRYTFDGDVTEWVKVPFNQARYGRDYCGDNVCTNTWWLIRDALAYWVEGKKESGWTDEQIRSYLETFDQQDRYDHDGDGNFDERDGYIDHFQIVHAGGDQADGDPIYASDSIWSHRWYAQIHGFGTDGPEGYAPFGGVEIGEGGPSDGGAVMVPDNKTGVWVGDYTIQPENGGLGVFAHEYAHDLGLPDHYDTSGAENSVGWWSLMSQSRGTLPEDGGIGDQAMPFGAYDKFYLGWLDYRTVMPNRSGRFKMRPSQAATKRGVNAVIALLPDKEVPLELGAPCATCGEQYYYSDSGDDLNNWMAKGVAGGGDLTAKVRYEIEDGWDYAFLEARVDGSWVEVDNSEAYAGEDQSGFNSSGHGISGTTGGDWVDLTATVPAAADAIRWRYQTDGAYVLPGFQVDNITLDGTPIGTAEGGADGWTLDGFRVTTGSETNEFLHAYMVENRQYKGLDKPLSHLYNFGGTKKKSGDWVEFFRNQPGALINYYDTSQSDNNVGVHPGQGLILPVDANPSFVHTPNGALARPRINAWNSTFTPRRMKGQTLHFQGEDFRLPGNRGVATFDDTKDWWFDSDEHGDHAGERYRPGWYGVDVPKTGTTIKIQKVTKKGFIWVKVS